MNPLTHLNMLAKCKCRGYSNRIRYQVHTTPPDNSLANYNGRKATQTSLLIIEQRAVINDQKALKLQISFTLRMRNCVPSSWFERLRLNDMSPSNTKTCSHKNMLQGQVELRLSLATLWKRFGQMSDRSKTGKNKFPACHLIKREGTDRRID